MHQTNLVSSISLCSPTCTCHFHISHPIRIFFSWLSLLHSEFRIDIIMKRNCYLNLRSNPSSRESMNEALNVNQQMVAIPHSRRHMLDVTELQARVIIWLGSQEMEARKGNKGPASIPLFPLQPQALLMQGFCIKRSLHNFLQKRKKRSKSHV
ncbi:protein JAZ13 [Lotus japonicus]|uniref:protein JAZ13 n=1 Tax=Lotus japonicus TaxID=34305 RepID=UPI00258B03EA|nr:protein JAZ13 [Lotus japonicus]